MKKILILAAVAMLTVQTGCTSSHWWSHSSACDPCNDCDPQMTPGGTYLEDPYSSAPVVTPGPDAYLPAS